MKGLLIKDFQIVMKNRKIFIMLLFILVFSVMSGKQESIYFLISYTTIMCSSFVLTTISTDEFDKSTSFLMVLPIKRSTYAIEKYVFSLLFGLAGCITSTVISCVIASGNINEILMTALVLYITLSLFQLIMIPVQLKYGGENGRIVLIGLIVAIISLVFIIKEYLPKIVDKQVLEKWLYVVYETIQSITPIGMVFLGLIILLFGVIISMNISVKIMQKREF